MNSCEYKHAQKFETKHPETQEAELQLNHDELLSTLSESLLAETQSWAKTQPELYFHGIYNKEDIDRKTYNRVCELVFDLQPSFVAVLDKHGLLPLPEIDDQLPFAVNAFQAFCCHQNDSHAVDTADDIFRSLFFGKIQKKHEDADVDVELYGLSPLSLADEKKQHAPTQEMIVIDEGMRMENLRHILSKYASFEEYCQRIYVALGCTWDTRPNTLSASETSQIAQLAWGKKKACQQ